MEAVNEDVNTLTVAEGQLPEKSGECFLDVEFAEAQGYQIGDQIELREDTEDPFLKKKTYTVTGLGRSPLYISFNRGNTTLGSGEVNGFVYVLPEDFDQEVFTQIYIRVHGVDQVTSYTDAYDRLIEKLQDKVEGIQAERCQIRYEDVMTEAEKELADAEKELSDGKKEAEEELADARKELEDGEKEYSDGKKEYEDGKKQLSDGEKEISDGKEQLASAKETLAEGRDQLAAAKQQAADGWSQLNEAQEKLSDGWSQYNSGKKQLQEGRSQLNQAKKQLADGQQKIEESKAALDEKQDQLDTGLAQAEKGIQAVEGQIAQLQDQISQLEEGIRQAEEAEAQIQALTQALEAAQRTAAEKQAAFDAAQSAVSEAQAGFDTAQAALEEAVRRFEAGEITEEELASYQTCSGNSKRKSGSSSGKSRKQPSGELNAANGAGSSGAGSCWIPVRRQQQRSRSWKPDLRLSRNGLAQAEKRKRQSWFRPVETLKEGQKAIDAGRETLKQEEAKLEPAKKQIAANEKKLTANEKKLQESLADLNSGQAEIDANRQKLNSAQGEIEANEQKLNSGEQEIETSQQKITDGEAELRENRQKLADAEKDLKEAEQKLKDGWKEYEDGKKEAEDEIAEGGQKIEDARKEISEIEEPEWIVTDRNDLPEYSDYGDNADRIKSIGEVFPVIFFLVAALISLTTMTRMVEEQRTQIGTLKALGYGKFSIASKYLNYAFLATVGGSAAGVLIGEKILPYIIIKAYGIMYHNVGDSLQIHYELKFALTASVAAIVCTVGATVISCYRVLSETPASLMRPPAPKEGKRVLVEKITILWKHLNFTWKSSLRNLFRYKKRLFMTIFGISGSMALMLVGFGIRDSISDIVVKQYSELQHYDGTIITDEDASDEDREKLMEYLDKNEKLERFTNIQFSKITAPNGKSNISVYLYVPENMETFREDVTLRNRLTGEAYELTDEGAVISEKTAKLLNLQVGDTITLERENEGVSRKSRL